MVSAGDYPALLLLPRISPFFIVFYLFLFFFLPINPCTVKGRAVLHWRISVYLVYFIFGNHELIHNHAVL